MAFVPRIDDPNKKQVAKRIVTNTGYFEVGTIVTATPGAHPMDRGYTITDEHGNKAYEVHGDNLESLPPKYAR